MRSCEIRCSGRRRDDPFQVGKGEPLGSRNKGQRCGGPSLRLGQFIMMLFGSRLQMKIFFDGVPDKQWTSSGQQGVAVVLRGTYEIWRCWTLHHVESLIIIWIIACFVISLMETFRVQLSTFILQWKIDFRSSRFSFFKQLVRLSYTSTFLKCYELS